MERRSALKNMGMVFGYAVATPTMLSILNSCKEKVAYADWVPTFFDKEQGLAIAQIMDIILPKTDTPSATELNIHSFVDGLLTDTALEEDAAFSKMVTQKFFANAMAKSGKASIGALTNEDYGKLLAQYLQKATPAEKMARQKTIAEYQETIKAGGSAELDTELASTVFVNQLRDLATWAYKNTEHIGEEVLAYLPIPGEYVKCGTVEELTQGRAWSL